MKKVSYFLSHPIQYQSPLLKYLYSNLKNIDLEVVYFTDHTLGGLDRQFGLNVKWDVPLLEGYKYKFLKNYSLKPAVSGSFFGLINFGIIGYLIKRKPDKIVLHGWSYFSNLLLLVVSRILSIEVIMRAESPLAPEKYKSKLNKYFKNIVLSLCDKFLYVGIENKNFYKHFGIDDDKLYYSPYCVDNKRFIKSKQQFNPKKDSIKNKLGIQNDHKLILYCGKLINKKRPLDLLKAFKKIQNNKVSLIYVGTGALEDSINKFIFENHIKNVYFSGFVNQTELYKYYLSSDIFVLPSDYGETWGLVVNEAMLHNLPIVISDHVGCMPDLVHYGKNGYSYKCGDVNELSKIIESMIQSDNLKNMGFKSFDIVKNYSFKDVVKGFKSCLN